MRGEERGFIKLFQGNTVGERGDEGEERVIKLESLRNERNRREPGGDSWFPFRIEEIDRDGPTQVESKVRAEEKVIAVLKSRLW